MANKEKKIITVLGKTYKFDTELDDLELTALSQYVEEKISTVGATADVQTTSYHAILACLYIGEENLRLKENYDHLNDLITKKTNTLLNSIDTALSPGSKEKN